MFVKERWKEGLHFSGIEWLIFYQRVGGKGVVAPVSFQAPAPIQQAVVERGKCHEHVRMQMRLSREILEDTIYLEFEPVIELQSFALRIFIAKVFCCRRFREQDG